MWSQKLKKLIIILCKTILEQIIKQIMKSISRLIRIKSKKMR